jgi:NhaP-type Na+/H+ or K+/H+ antiporter
LFWRADFTAGFSGKSEIMNSYVNLALFSGLLLAYSILAGRQRNSWFNGPLLFLFAGTLVGPYGMNWLRPDVDAKGMRLLVEVTLAIVLFSDAANANLKVVVANRGLVARLLFVGLPLTIVAGWFFAGWIYPEVPAIMLGLIAVTLAPTDAALGKLVGSHPAVPEPVREGLNLESGLNDGICVPLLLTLLAVAAHEAEGATLSVIGLRMLEELGIGLVMGAVLAWSVTRAIHEASRRGWDSPAWRHLTLPGLALLCFGVTQSVGGSGFIAAFVGGLVAGPRLGKVKHSYLQGNEHYGDLLTVVVWVLFGALSGGVFQGAGDWRPWVYGLASLTVIRMVPVLISLVGSAQPLGLRLFLAWFGPRGLASVVFAILIHEQLGKEGFVLMPVVTSTVILSVVLHGITAGPWCRRLG